MTKPEASSIRSFGVIFPEAEFTDLCRRVNATKWPERETVTDATQGVQLATIQKLADYWGKDYDWSKCEAKLKALPHFITEIDGLDIHFVHVRSKHENALPMIVTHGWPGSVIEQLKIIGPLTNPEAHGGHASDAFHLVIPSLPGYGFSGKPSTVGWGPERIARTWTELMKRLGYAKYVAQGGDWGALITQLIGSQAAPALAGTPAPSGLSADERHAYDQLVFFYAKGLAYAQEMGNRPQTLYGIADSPIGLAGWILDHDASSYAMMSRVFDGKTEGLTRDDILDNITFYWLTNTGVSSARLYWENKLAFFAPQNIQIPVAVSVYPDEIYAAPRSWVEKAFPKLIYFNKLPKGGHFAAWEQPAFFVSDVRAAFKSLRT
jgi:pimeloyl-ACP methyl ester carboxylesterase